MGAFDQPWGKNVQHPGNTDDIGDHHFCCDGRCAGLGCLFRFAAEAVFGSGIDGLFSGAFQSDYRYVGGALQADPPMLKISGITSNTTPSIRRTLGCR